MIGGLGPLELTVLIGLFFILFGAERLPKMANALGRSKGEFQKGLSDTSRTLNDLEAGGRTPSQLLAERARTVGLDPAGMEVDELERKVAALESMDSSEE
ncbi:MAG: twin-arginine translocase TatA/TatE family subunit [Euryarchaeota archaeon]|jgi:sec-independent protein translocase protein TatA|nr:twin-arginine translocase TatA/TatE family subunit [Euryarchaeota archaeon]MBT5595523.1 twin-arginine translocase TatA/TatE family subunit [Euryarchaeota archaeon]MBT5844688.1 twin-arginine translocase TatA/TatE family subunit [Euryarchaeota archaeon]MBT6640964.1 twin-arginine translocase TatA/TatE family subunit [Euryarchaeota archaeon]MBT6845732.1 twin-arginine translocase TatA/TatE family subunit [Euryarchaeota archaeon]